MAVDVTLDSVVTGYDLSKINVNFGRLDVALQDAVSRSGTTPNNMNADFDMNGYQILNLPTPIEPNDVVRLQDLGTLYTDAQALSDAVDAAEASSTSAASSATSASTSAANAAASAVTASAQEKSIGWNFSDTITMSDPGATNLRFNNATLSSVTAIAVDATDVDSIDVSDYVATWGASTSPSKGTIIVRKVGSSSFFALYTVTAAVVDNTGWLQLTVSHVTSAGTVADGDVVYLHWTRAGDQGAAGVGSGDLVSTNNLSDVSNVATARTNLGLGDLATQSSVAAGQVNNNVITTAMVVDNAITLAKQASGTAGGVIVYDSSGNPTDIGAGTSTQVLTSNGTSTPSWSDAATTSQWELLSAAAPTAVNAIDFVFNEFAYSHIKIVGDGVIPASDNRLLRGRFGYSNGGTISTASDYLDFSGGSAQSYFNISDPLIGVGTATDESISFVLDLYGFQTPNGPPFVNVSAAYGRSSGGTTYFYKESWTTQNTALIQNRVDAIRIYWSSGNFETAGTLYFYGLKDS